MAVVKLITKRVEKPWGRLTLWPAFDDVMNCGEPVGEIWFQMHDGSEPELLVKYLFTSDNLSIQVPPDDEGAKRSEERRVGKECVSTSRSRRSQLSRKKNKQNESSHTTQ